MTETAKSQTPTLRKDQMPIRYMVGDNGTISSVARKFYGDLKYNRAIYQFNTEAIGANPNVLKPGIYLILPPKSAMDSWLLKNPKLPSVTSPEPKKDASSAHQTPTTNTTRLANKVALSFDDGPSRETTHDILEILKKHNVKATFFITGDKIRGREDLITAIVKEGHQIGNHSYHHQHLTAMTPKELEENLSKTEKEVTDVLKASGEFKGMQLPEISLVRPPGGRHNSNVDTAVNNRGDKLITWNINSKDWELENNPQEIVTNVLEKADTISTQGGNILLHDRQQTKQVLDKLITELKAMSYDFIFTEEFAK